MATNSRDVKLTLGVETTGTEDVQQLASDLEGVATAGKAAAPGVEKLAAELADALRDWQRIETIDDAQAAYLVAALGKFEDVERDAPAFFLRHGAEGAALPA